eukprot:4622114-Pyramimonas_sp.AAC.1
MVAEGVEVTQWARGYNIWAVMSVVCLSLTGLATSAVMKYADNLIKVQSVSQSVSQGGDERGVPLAHRAGHLRRHE